jgi:ATP-dependent Clp protease ATP-binding subunit ClpC
MYSAWARKRGMRFDTLSLGGQTATVFSGLGAYTILAPEAGLHTLELPRRNRAYERVSALVTVAPLAATGSDVSLEERARRALERQPPVRRIVRRYRREPSPLVRDSVRGWRTGRLDAVLGGNFDLIV